MSPLSRAVWSGLQKDPPVDPFVAALPVLPLALAVEAVELVELDDAPTTLEVDPALWPVEPEVDAEPLKPGPDELAALAIDDRMLAVDPCDAVVPDATPPVTDDAEEPPTSEVPRVAAEPAPWLPEHAAAPATMALSAHACAFMVGIDTWPPAGKEGYLVGGALRLAFE